MSRRRQPSTLSVNEAASILGVHKATLYRWCEAGLITYIRPTPTSPRRFRPDDVYALLEPIERTVPAS